MVNIIKEEIEIEESLESRLRVICDFCNTTPIIENGSIRRIDKTNLTYIEPHRIIIKDITFLIFNYSNEIFIEKLKTQMYKSLTELNKGMSRNSKICISEKGNGWITVSPSDPQPEPSNIVKLKAEITKMWPMTNLLDVIKETDLRLSFTNEF